MDITCLGYASFRLKGKSALVVTDPYNSVQVGLKFPKDTTADIVTISHGHEDHNFSAAVGGSPVIFSGPGEYEAKGVDILGIESFHDDKNGQDRGKNTLFRFEIDNISILHCGDLGHKLTQDQIAQIGDLDILLIPVGGFYTIDAKTAAEIATELEPAVIIPMHYQRPGLIQSVFGQLLPVSLFFKEMGKEGVIPQTKLKITHETLPQEAQIVILE